MSDSTITVNPRKKSGQKSGRVAPPPITQPANQVKGTVLVRTPLPKYSFEQKPMKKDTAKKETKNEIKQTENVSSKIAESNSLKSKSPLVTSKESKNIPHQNTASISQSAPPVDPFLIGSFVTSFPQTYVNPNAIIDSKLNNSGHKNVENGDQSAGNVTVVKDKPVNKVGPISKSSDKRLTHSVSDSMLGVQNVPRSSLSQQNRGIVSRNRENVCLNMSDASTGSDSHVIIETETGYEDYEAEVDSSETETVAQSAVAISRGCNCEGKITQLEEEKQMMKNQLEVQLQVNFIYGY